MTGRCDARGQAALLTSAGLLLAGLVVTSDAAAERLLVFPLKAKSIGADTAVAATERVALVARRVPDVRVIDSAAISRDLGFDLAEQAHECANDILCMIQIAEVVGAERAFVGSLQRQPDGANVLRLSLLDVAKAALIDTLRWEVPPRPDALAGAIDLAVRHLIADPDTTVIFDVSPSDAEITFYDAPSDAIVAGTPIPFWSGVYYGRAERDGYDPKSMRVEIARGGPVRITVELEADPLWVGSGKKPRRARRRAAPPVAPDPVAVIRPPPPVIEPASSPFANYFAWGLVAVGVGTAVGGGVKMSGAQGDYNVVASEPRFSTGTTASKAAGEIRGAAQDGFSVGSKLVATGVGVVAAGLLWIAVDFVLLAGSPEDAPTGSPSAAGVRF